VAQKDEYDVINYVIATENTFEMLSSDDLGGAIRRECRGLIFDKSGKLISRPFHKFFNVGEKEETQIYKIESDMMSEHVIMEKMDGSMIRPIIVNDELRLATKMGITDIALEAENWLFQQDPSFTEWLKRSVENNMTPLFEWISPSNLIVIQYDSEGLVYLGSRNNYTGEYLFENNNYFRSVPLYGRLQGNLSEYISRQRQAEGREGDIIRFNNGHMLKIKNDWYVRIHKVKDKIRSEHHIVDLILNEGLDDIYPNLDKNSYDFVKYFEKEFWDSFNQNEQKLRECFADATNKFGNDRKAIATQFVSKLPDKANAQFIFGQLDNKDLREMMLSFISKHISTRSRFETVKSWMDFYPLSQKEILEDTEEPNLKF
jgi:RNA ligase